MDAGYKTPWITKKILEDSRIPILPYTRSKTAKGHFQPWDYKYDEITDTLTCPEGKPLRHTTTDKDGKRIYRSNTETRYWVNPTPRFSVCQRSLAVFSNESSTKWASFKSCYRMVCTLTMLVLPWVLSGMPAVITTVSPECR